MATPRGSIAAAKIGVASRGRPINNRPQVTNLPHMQVTNLPHMQIENMPHKQVNRQVDNLGHKLKCGIWI